ncbi:MAG: transcriptional repressor LexA [Thermodesulfobacteriota bacterium]
MSPSLTPRQLQLLEYINHEIHHSGEAPSLRRAGAHMGVSHSAVSQLIRTLEKKEILRREGRYSRTLFFLNRARNAPPPGRWREIPIVGKIAAGRPLYAQQEWGGSLVVDADIYRGRSLFALKICGDSMKNAAILDGDLAICEPRQFAEDGEIVAALIQEEEATVKRFFLHKNRIELRPENPVYASTFHGFDEILIQGRVIGIQRGPDGISEQRGI